MDRSEVPPITSAYRLEGERGAPTVFVGRDVEIDAVVRRASSVAEACKPGRTVVIQGPPGAGKTALLREIGERFAALGPDHRVVGPIAPWTANGLTAALARLAGALFDVEPQELRRTLQTSASTQVGASALLKGELTSSRGQTVAPPVVADRDGFELVFADRSVAGPTLVLVDEAQTFKDDGGLVLNLHTQEKLPVVLVCGGLSDTEDKLRSIGLTRLGDESVLNLGPLSSDETRDCVARTLAAFAAEAGHVTGEFDAWIAPVAEASNNWPQHLALYLNAARAEADERGEFTLAGLQAALALGHAARERYYGQRLVYAPSPAASPAVIDPRVALAAHTAAKDDGERRPIVIQAIHRAALRLPPIFRADHEGHFPGGPGQCLDAMIHAGLIERRRDGLVVGTRIPSFRSYLTQRAENLREPGTR